MTAPACLTCQHCVSTISGYACWGRLQYEPVTGQQLGRLAICRRYDPTDPCGPKGKLWVKREVEESEAEGTAEAERPAGVTLQ